LFAVANVHLFSDTDKQLKEKSGLFFF